MLVSDFDFDLPEELIAQAPLAERDGARMLVVDRATGALTDRQFRDLPELLQAGDVLVLNDSRVIPARLYARRAGLHTQSNSQQPTGSVEVLLTKQLSLWEWTALVRPGRKVQVGERLLFAETENSEPLLEAEVIAHGEFGERTLRFTPVQDFYSALDKLGHMPLPPYIHRDDAAADKERYQTVFAHERGSAAAPTAGLHFTPRVLDMIRARGVQIVYVTLHVGLGTFQPVRVERVEEIHLHTERYTLPAETALAINDALREGRRVIAAGTTTVRTLEHCAQVAEGGPLKPHSGETSIFISPGYRFRIVSGLLTNFHLPQSTLLMLVCAFAGQPQVLAAYRHAVAERYRFFSYGDCMFLS
ncbi:MAG: tRNA preQ1(34) S-adenosylmethionine ribosyltransferase-isomerase QueA [Acidobacteriaceae bacterium]